MEGEKTKLLIATEAQKVMQVEAETEKKKATIAAQMRREVSEINIKRQIMEKEADQKVAALEDKIQSAHSRARTDSDFYAALKESEGNEKRLTDAYIEFTRIMAMANNTKVYFGERIPNMLLSKGLN